MKRIALFLSIVLLLFSCTTDDIASVNQDNLSQEKYINIASGIEYFRYNTPLPLVCHIAKIDLRKVNINLYPTESTCIKQGWFKAKNPVQFARKTQSLLVINTTPFTSKRNLRKLSGVHIIGEKQLGSVYPAHAALKINNGKASLEKEQCLKETDANLVIGGFFCILQKGKIIEGFLENHDARMAIGIDDTQAILYVLCTEKSFRSKGASYKECATILQNLGAVDALEFDGGSSTHFVLNFKEKSHGFLHKKPASLLGFSSKN